VKYFKRCFEVRFPQVISKSPEQQHEADELLSHARKLKDAIEFEITTYTRRTVVTNQTAEATLVVIETMNAEVESITQLLDSGKITIPEKIKEQERKRSILINDIEELGFKNEDKGSNFYLKRQLQLERAKAENATVDTFIAEVTAKKADLS
jgi:hypothetical protein